MLDSARWDKDGARAAKGKGVNIMELNLPRNVRAGLYILIIVGSPVIGYLSMSEFIGANEVALWSALTTAVAAVARLNLTPKE